MGRVRWVFAWVVTVAIATPEPAATQAWSWPERAENLTELPPDFPPERLSAVMRGFTQALGVRCTHCHVGEEGQPLSTYDFVSDANPNKDRARSMYRMLGVVNDHLGEIEPSGERVNMWCHTCHAGRPRPQTLAEAVTERYRAAGAESAWEHFIDLRARYYGAGAYDFTAASVDALGAELLPEDTVAAYRFFEHNVESYPTDSGVQERMGDVWLARSDTAQAVRAFEEALRLRPGNARVADKLSALRGS